MFTDMVYVTLFLKGLTPLYHACLSGKNPNVAELLLGDQADIGVVDSQGWQEIHQVKYASLPDNSIYSRCSSRWSTFEQQNLPISLNV